VDEEDSVTTATQTTGWTKAELAILTAVAYRPARLPPLSRAAPRPALAPPPPGPRAPWQYVVHCQWSQTHSASVAIRSEPHPGNGPSVQIRPASTGSGHPPDEHPVVVIAVWEGPGDFGPGGPWCPRGSPRAEDQSG